MSPAHRSCGPRISLSLTGASNTEKPPCDPLSVKKKGKSELKSILREDGTVQIREMWITHSSLLRDPILSHSGVTGSQIRLGAFMEGAVRDDEHRGGE